MRFCVSRLVVVALAFMGLTFSAPQGYAEVYKWVDGDGTVWFTDDPANLPEESHSEFEKVGTGEKVPDSSPRKTAPRPSATKGGAARSTKTYLENENRRHRKKRRLEEEISTLEKELAAGRRGLQRVPFTGRRGYWFVIDPATGKKVRASYKDPGAIWSTDTWPGVPIKARTTESEERKRIQSDIEKIEGDLNKAKERLSALSRSF